MGKIHWRELDDYERAGEQKIKRRVKFTDDEYIPEKKKQKPKRR